MNLEQLCRTKRNTFLSQALRKTRNLADAEDLVQDACLSILLRPPPDPVPIGAAVGQRIRDVWSANGAKAAWRAVVVPQIVQEKTMVPFEAFVDARRVLAQARPVFIANVVGYTTREMAVLIGCLQQSVAKVLQDNRQGLGKKFKVYQCP